MSKYTKTAIVIVGALSALCGSAGMALAHTNALNFTWQNAYLAYLKEQPDFDYKSNMKSLTKVFYPNVYQKYKNNEFQLHGKEQDALEKIKDRVSKFGKPIVFKLTTNASFGKYNFSKQQFPFRPFKKGTYFLTCQMRACPTVDLLIENPGFINAIKMKEEAAKKLVDSRNTSYGSVNRQITVSVLIKTVGVLRPSQSSTNNPSLKGEIIEAKAYTNSNESHVIQSWSKKSHS